MKASGKVKLVWLLLRNRKGLTYNALVRRLNLDMHTIGLLVTMLSKRGYVRVDKKQSLELRRGRGGRRWVNVVYPSNKLVEGCKDDLQLLQLLSKL